MEKDKLDQLYYLLREASNGSTDITDAVYGLAGHLLAGKDYLRLIQYCRFYGENFLLKPTCGAIAGKNWAPKRFVEFGAGLGWLSRGLASWFRIDGVLTVDKRPWTAIDVLADLETDKGKDTVSACLKDGDIIVMSDFLHCTEDPEDILRTYCGYPIAILEYMPADKSMWDNYTEQLERYGGNPINAEDMAHMLINLGRPYFLVDLDPYVLMLIDKET